MQQQLLVCPMNLHGFRAVPLTETMPEMVNNSILLNIFFVCVVEEKNEDKKEGGTRHLTLGKKSNLIL